MYEKSKMILSKLVEYVKLRVVYDFKKCIRFVFEFYSEKHFFISILGNDRHNLSRDRRIFLGAVGGASLT
jgi:hypothetical protein